MNELNLYKSNRSEDGQLMDWTKAAASLTSGIATAAGMRDLRRTENEQFKKSAEEEVTKDLNLRDNTLNDVLVFGTSAGRSKINQLYDDMKNGRISRAQYKASMANIKTNWNKTAEYIKNIDNMYSAALDDVESGKSSQIRAGIVDYFGRLNDLGNKALSFDDNGIISIAVFNNEQKPIAYQEVNSLYNLMNTQFDKVDLTGMADVATKNLATNKKYNVTDIRAFHPEVYEGERKTFQNTVLSNSKSIASILVDYGGYGFYFGEGDKATALERLKQTKPDATEADLVLLKQDKPGNISGDFTPEQLKKAMDIVGNEFDARFGRQVDYTPGYGSGGGGLTANQKLTAAEQEDKRQSLWRLTYDSFNNPSGKIDRNVMSGKLTSATGGKFIFMPNPSGPGYIVEDKSGNEIISVDSALKSPTSIWTFLQEIPEEWTERWNVSGLRKKESPKGSANNLLQTAKQGVKPKSSNSLIPPSQKGKTN
jgi:hypothetical protein